MEIREEPLAWYVSKLERSEPFSSLLYGDGEFMVAAGRVNGQRYTHYKENITPEIALEMKNSLTVVGDDIVRGTDPHLINWKTYKGRDWQGIFNTGALIEETVNLASVWYDGVVWDCASRDGLLGPLLKVLKTRDIYLVSNAQLRGGLGFLPIKEACTVPEEDALGQLESFKFRPRDGWVYIFCAGLLAVPAIMRLRERNHNATFLDLGSCLDVFASLGAERGWRKLLYSVTGDREKLVAKHLEGLV